MHFLNYGFGGFFCRFYYSLLTWSYCLQSQCWAHWLRGSCFLRGGKLFLSIEMLIQSIYQPPHPSVWTSPSGSLTSRPLAVYRGPFLLSFSTPTHQQSRSWGSDCHPLSFKILELFVYFCHFSIEKTVGTTLLFSLFWVCPVPYFTYHDILISNLTLLTGSFFRNGF